MSKKFIHLHQHDIQSNGGGYFEVVSKIEDYIDIAKERGHSSLTVSNHGNVVDYVDRWKKTTDAGLKYIHSIEAYVTMDDKDTDPKNKTRDNYHLLLIARNWEGVKELNKLSSISFNRDDNHYYYNPRMFFDDIKRTSDNIIILTACMSSPLWRSHKNGEDDIYNEWLDFFVENKHRVYLEVQPHIDEDQKEFNKILLDIAKKHDMKIVASNDVHAATERHDELRKIIKLGKKLEYEGDDAFELWAKDRDEMFNTFVEQGVLSEGEINEALDNTVFIADSIDEFDMDTSYKYPKMFDKKRQMVGNTDVSNLKGAPFDSSLDVFRQLIVEGYVDRGIDKLPIDKQKEYKERVNSELDVYVKTGSIDYMLLEWSLKKEAREKVVNPQKSIHPGYGRGSVTGSLVAFLLRITEMDSVKEGLNFARFMSEARVTLADIDTDFTSEDRYSIMHYLLEHNSLNCASISTKNSYAIKGSIGAVGRGMDYSPSEIMEISRAIDANDGSIPNSVRKEHSELIELAELAVGSTDSFGRHASGILVSDLDVDEILGTMTLPNWDYKVTQNDMGSVEMLGFVKLDILGLDSLELIHNAAEMIGLSHEDVSPQSEIIDWEDKDMWESLREDNTAIFQFESERAGDILNKMLSDETMDNIREFNPDITYMDVINIANAGQRPQSASYLNELMNGIPEDNGHKALNEFLADTQGYILYQETITKFLVDFCGYTEGHADVLRRAIGSKNAQAINEEVPKIKEAFINTMISEHGDTREHAEDVADGFMQVIIDSSNYGFSINHSASYSTITGVMLFLRYHYPLEFTAAALEIWQKTDKERRVLAFAEKHNISINPPKFRKSKGGYFVDKKNNAIFQGTGHIKYVNTQTADILYRLRDREYLTFTDLVLDVIENANITYDGETLSIQDFYKKYGEDEIKEIDKLRRSNDSILAYKKDPLSTLGVTKTKMHGLIKLNFFEEFGKPKKLLAIYDNVLKSYKPNNKTFANKHKRYHECLEFERAQANEDFSVIEQCEHELDLTGRVSIHSETIPPRYAFVTDVDVRRTITNATVYSINKGKSTQIKVGNRTYRQAKFKKGDLIELQEMDVKARRVQQDGQWVPSPTEKDLWVRQLKFIRKSNIK